MGLVYWFLVVDYKPKIFILDVRVEIGEARFFSLLTTRNSLLSKKYTYSLPIEHLQYGDEHLSNSLVQF